MKKAVVFITIIFTRFVIGGVIYGQTISSSLPPVTDKNHRYIFYLHGAVVSVSGDNAINRGAPEWGPYEYSNILDSLKHRGFNVISEIRKQDVEDAVYINKITTQIDSLLAKGINPSGILLTGASSGWNIVLHVSATLKRRDIHYAIMGGCWPDTYKEYEQLELYGHFLSVIEKTDPHQTCYRIFETRKHISSHKEIMLNTGLSHGFFYKGRKEWMDPVLEWFAQ